GILTPEIMKIMDAPAEAGGVPYRVAIHPSGRFAYVTNWAGLSLSVFAINETSGELSPVDGSPFATGGRPYAVTVHPSGRFVYVTSWDSDAVWGYVIDSSSGRLTPLPDSPFLTYGQSPISIVFSTSGKRAYVSNTNSNSITVYDVDGNTGNLRVTDKTQTRNQPFGLVLLEDAGSDNENILPAGDGPGYVYVSRDDHDQLYIRDAESSGRKGAGITGQASKAPVLAAVVNQQSHFVYMSHDDGKGGKDGGLAVYRINGQTGELTGIPELVYRLGFVPSDLAIDTGGQFLYAVNRDKQSLGVFEIDQGKGGLLHVPGQLPETGGGAVAIALDPVGRYSFVANSADNTVSVFSHRRVNTPAMYPVNRQGSNYPVGGQPVDLVVNPSGKYLVVANRESDNLSVFEIHHLNGQLEAVKGSPFASGKSPVAVAFHPNGRFLYVVNEGDSNIAVYHLDLFSGQLTEKTSRVGVLPGSMSIKLDAEGQFAYVLNRKNELQKFSVDRDTGQLKRLLVKKTAPVIAVVK
ncbi:lactonase family protein, partial [Kaarinaea lacus]